MEYYRDLKNLFGIDEVHVFAGGIYEPWKNKKFLFQGGLANHKYFE